MPTLTARSLRALIARKRAGSELSLGPPIKSLDDFLSFEITRLEEIAKKFEPPNHDINEINKSFREILGFHEFMNKSSISLKKIVGNEIYQVWIDMLKSLVPRGRTHRLSIMVASMLEYAASLAVDDEDLDPVTAEIFIAVRDGAYDPQVSIEKIMPIVETLFRDAGVKSDRFNSKGQPYSIADSAAYQFLTWYNMPWED